MFKNVEWALMKMAMMTVGEVDYEDRFVDNIFKRDNNNSTINPLDIPHEASLVFLSLFLILMIIVLMNLLVCIKTKGFSVTLCNSLG